MLVLQQQSHIHILFAYSTVNFFRHKPLKTRVGWKNDGKKKNGPAKQYDSEIGTGLYGTEIMRGSTSLRLEWTVRLYQAVRFWDWTANVKLCHIVSVWDCSRNAQVSVWKYLYQA